MPFPLISYPDLYGFLIFSLLNFFENIKLALRSIRSNLLRSILTLMIISVGIACLVGILTAIDTILFNLSSNFNRVGANSFTVYPGFDNLRSNRRGKQEKQAEVISFKQAMKFKESFDFPNSEVSVHMNCSYGTAVKYKNEKTNPTVSVTGIDDLYLNVSAYDLGAGRNFSNSEIYSGNKKCIIASGLVKKFFNDIPEKAIGEILSVGSDKYKIVGALKEKGSSMSQSGENIIFIPLLAGKINYGHSNTNYRIVGAVKESLDIDDAVSAAIGKLRNIRRLKFNDNNDFTIRKSDGILETLRDVTSELRLITIVIALLTLFGASVGLMNIMLVSVTERTKEIGVRKALGATSANIRNQFLTEAVIICLMGGVVGIILGLFMGLGVSRLVGGEFKFPIAWVILGIVVCVVVGVLSGLYPSNKASRLDPIESLRYE